MSKAETDERLSKLEVFLPLIIGVLGWGSAAIAMGQDVSWDLQNYHLYNGYAYVTGQLERDIAPAQLQTYYNPILDAATYVLTERLVPRAVGFILGAIQGLNFWLIYLIGCAIFTGFTHRAKVFTALLCATVGTCGVIGLSEAGTTFHDLTTSAFVLGAVLLFFRAKLGRIERMHEPFAWAGVCIGVGVGLKYTLASYGLAIAVAMALTGDSWRATARQGIWWAGGAAFGALLSGGGWMWKLYKMFGNPLFPYYNGLFRSPYFEPHNIFDERYIPATLGDALLFPFRSLGMELTFHDSRYAIVFLLAGIIVFVSLLQRVLRKQGILGPSAAVGPSGKWLFIFFFVAYAVWEKQFAMYRYTAALEQLSPIIIVLLLSKLVSDRRQVISVAILPFAITETTLDVPNWGRVTWGSRFLEVSVPKLPSPSNTTVMMTSGDALSFVIPAFPRSVRFVRAQANFFGPESHTTLTDKVTEALRPVDRDYYLLTVSDRLPDAAGVAGTYGFEIVNESCVRIRTNFDGPQNAASPLMFCHLRRSTGAPSADGAHPSGIISANPDPLPVCQATGVGAATVRWSARGANVVEVRVGAPDGSIWTSGGPSGSGETGPWVSDGTTFYLQNASNGNGAGFQNTLAKVVVKAMPGGPCH